MWTALMTALLAQIFLTPPGCVVPEAHADRAAVVDDDLLDGAAGADDRPVRDRAPDERVVVAVHVAARRDGLCDGRRQHGRYTLYRGDRHTRKVRERAGDVGDVSLVDLEGFALDELVHVVEHGPLEHLLGPHLGHAVPEHLHVRDRVFIEFDVARVRRGPEGRA